MDELRARWNVNFGPAQVHQDFQVLTPIRALALNQMVKLDADHVRHFRLKLGFLHFIVMIKIIELDVVTKSLQV